MYEQLFNLEWHNKNCLVRGIDTNCKLGGGGLVISVCKACGIFFSIILYPEP